MSSSLDGDVGCAWNPLHELLLLPPCHGVPAEAQLKGSTFDAFIDKYFALCLNNIHTDGGQQTKEKRSRTKKGAYWKCNFPMSSRVRVSVGWSVFLGANEKYEIPFDCMQRLYKPRYLSLTVSKIAEKANNLLIS